MLCKTPKEEFLCNPEELIGGNLSPGNMSFTVGKISTIFAEAQSNLLSVRSSSEMFEVSSSSFSSSCSVSIYPHVPACCV